MIHTIHTTIITTIINLNLKTLKYMRQQIISAYQIKVLVKYTKIEAPSNMYKNIGSFKNLGAYKNIGTSKNLGAYQNIGASKNLGAYKNIGTSKNLGAYKNIGASKNLCAYKNIGARKEPGVH